MYYDAARKAFQENLERIDPGRDPERYNLYAGLVALVSALEAEARALRNEFRSLESRLPRPGGGKLDAR